MAIPTYLRSNHHSTAAGLVRLPDGLRHESHCPLQNSYYTTIESRKKGTTWATRLIIKCWNLIYHLWTHHNSVLHEIQALDALSGVNILHNSIIVEYALGQSSLCRVYSRYFSVRLETVLQKQTDQLKQWFLVGRSRHEAIHVSTTDPFTTNTALCNWIGLPPIQI